VNQLQPFVYEGQDVRAISIKGEPWWVAKDVCDVFGESNRNRAMQSLYEDEKGYTQIETPGGLQQVAVVNESGLYSLLFAMQPTKARGMSNDYIIQREQKLKTFKRWVTHEVLPQIRKTGSYGLPSYPDALRQLASKIEENEKLLPKAEMHDLFMTGVNAQPVGEVAKVLGVGRNTLFKTLRELKILMENNVPYQKYLDSGHLEVIEKPVVIGDMTINKPVTLVTPKGINYIGCKLIDGGYINATHALATGR
jgi:anti-repressor protein